MLKQQKRAKVVAVKPADEGNVVATLEGGVARFRRTPCAGCPWVKENTGRFPAEAFRLSAPTAYDAAVYQFACHESGPAKPTTCAGFLLRNADNNLGVRLSVITKGWDLRKLDAGPRELHASYRAMAVANGVDPHEPVLTPCRANDEYGA